MQARERQLHLGLDADGARDGQVRAPTRRGARAAPTSRCRPRRAAPATGSRRGGRRRSDRPAGRTRRLRPRRLMRGKPPRSIRSCADQGVTRVHTGVTGRECEQACRRPNERCQASRGTLMSSLSDRPGSVSGAPNLPAGFTDTFTSRYVDTGELRLHAVIGGEGRRCCCPRLAGDLVRVAPADAGAGPGLRGHRGRPARQGAVRQAGGRLRHRHAGRRSGRAHGRARPRAVRRRRPRHGVRDQLRARRRPPGAGRARGPRRDPRLPGRGALAAGVRPRADQRPALAPARSTGSRGSTSSS